MLNLFYNLLCFIGVRKDYPEFLCFEEEDGNNTSGRNGNLFYNMVKKIIQKKGNQNNENRLNRHNETIFEEDFFVNKSQPRKLTRFVYERKKKSSLSPHISVKRPLINITDDDSTDSKSSIVPRFSLSIYTAFIGLILCVQPIYTLIIILTSETEQETLYISSLFFQIVYPLQYYYCVRYFFTDHFDHFYFDDKSPVCVKKMIYTLNQLTFVIIGCSLINVVTNITRVLATDYDGEFPLVFQYNVISRVFISFLLVSSWTYGNLILFTNLIIFCIIFRKHVSIFRSFAKKIQSKHNKLDLNQIMQILVGIKYQLGISISDFEYIFSSFTFFGAISFGFYIDQINNGNFENIPWNLVVTYVIVQIVFFRIISQVKRNRDALFDFVKNPIYVEKYLKRYTVEDIQTHFLGDDADLILLNLLEEIGNEISWNSLNTLLTDSSWTEFKFFGIEVSDFALIKKGIVLVSFIVFADRILSSNGF